MKEKPKRKKGRRVLTFFIVLLIVAGGIYGAGAILYKNVPEVKEAVDTIVLVIKGKEKEKEKEKEIVQLAQVKDILYDELTRSLTFSPVENATEYVITFRHLDFSNKYTYRTNSPICEIQLPSGTLTGHTLQFEVVAIGGENFKPSEKSTYTYAVQFESQSLYESLSKTLYQYVNRGLGDEIRGTRLNFISSINILGKFIIINGNTTDKYNTNYNFTLTYDCSNYSGELGNVNNVVDFANISKSISNHKDVQLSYVNTDNFVNVSEGLAYSDLFLDYIIDGYTITTVQQENSAVYDVSEGVKGFNVTGIYKATCEGKDTVTFKATQIVRMPSNPDFKTDEDYFTYFNEGGDDIEIIDGEFLVFDYGLMNEFYIIEAYKNGTPPPIGD